MHINFLKICSTITIFLFTQINHHGNSSHRLYHLNKKKKSNKSGYPDEAIKTLARCFYPSMVEFFNSEEGQREYEEWLKEQEALQALPVAA